MKPLLLFKAACLSLLSFFLLSKSSSAQAPERKIIIADSRYFYTTVHDEFQLATLHTGKVEEPLADGILLALPAGRNYDEPVNPFSWDLQDGQLFAVNFLNHPLNDRYEALKRIPLSELHSSGNAGHIEDLLLQSTEQYTYTDNAPYRFLKKQTKFLDHFFYDLAAGSDSAFYMIMANEGQWQLWHFDGENWQHRAGKGMELQSAFSLVFFKNKLYLFSGEGKLFALDTSNAVPKLISTKAKSTEGAPGILIEDRDRQQLYWLAADELDYRLSISELKQKAIRLL